MIGKESKRKLIELGDTAAAKKGGKISQKQQQKA